MSKLWSEIEKPEKYRNIAYSDVFKVDVFPVSHFIYQKNDFISDVSLLRQFLTDKDSTGYFFKDQKLENIPFDSMYLYMKEIWNIIEQDKEINIPNQKIMVSTFRCNEVKNEILTKCIESFNVLRRELK